MQVGAHIKALAVLCKRKVVAVEQGDQLVEVWVKQLLEESGNILESCIKSPSSRGTAQEGAEDAFRTPVSQTREMQGDKQTENRWNKDRGQVKGQVVSATQLETVVFTVGALALVCPRVKDARVVTLVQTLITTAKRVIGRTRGGEAQRLLIREKVTPEVYVHLWVALGKLCLADDSLAKRCIPLFVQVSYPRQQFSHPGCMGVNKTWLILWSLLDYPSRSSAVSQAYVCLSAFFFKAFHDAQLLFDEKNSTGRMW